MRNDNEDLVSLFYFIITDDIFERPYHKKQIYMQMGLLPWTKVLQIVLCLVKSAELNKLIIFCLFSA